MGSIACNVHLLTTSITILLSVLSQGLRLFDLFCLRFHCLPIFHSQPWCPCKMLTNARFAEMLELGVYVVDKSFIVQSSGRQNASSYSFVHHHRLVEGS